MTDTLSNEELVRHLCGHSACKDQGTYTVRVGCTNCDWKGSLELTKGHEFSRLHACPQCGCTYTLMRRSS